MIVHSLTTRNNRSLCGQSEQRRLRLKRKRSLTIPLHMTTTRDVPNSWRSFSQNGHVMVDQGCPVRTMDAHNVQQTQHLRGYFSRFSIPVLVTVTLPFTVLTVGYHFALGFHHSQVISEMMQLLLMLYIASSMASCLFYLLGLPNMLGAFLTGVILRHCFHVVVIQRSSDDTLSMARSISVAVLSLQVSVSMDFFTLTTVKRTVVILSTLPFLLELSLTTAAIYALKYLHLSFSSSAVTGSSVNVIAPPIVLAIAAHYHTHIYTIQRKTLSIIVAAACLEEILATTILSLTRQYHISIESDSEITSSIIEVINSFLYGPIGAVVGMTFAYIWAYSSLTVIKCTRKFSLEPIYCQSVHLTSGAVLLVLFATLFKLPLAITAGCLVLGAIVSSAWRDANENTEVLRNTLMLLWTLICPLYFGLLGNHLPLEVFDIQPQVVTRCVAMPLLLISFISRLSSTLLITRLAHWPGDDCLFACFAMLPKSLTLMNISQYALLKSLTDTAILIITPLAVIFHLLSTTVSVYMTSMLRRNAPLNRTVKHSICISGQPISNDKETHGVKSSQDGILNRDLC